MEFVGTVRKTTAITKNKDPKIKGWAGKKITIDPDSATQIAGFGIRFDVALATDSGNSKPFTLLACHIKAGNQETQELLTKA